MEAAFPNFCFRGVTSENVNDFLGVGTIVLELSRSARTHESLWKDAGVRQRAADIGPNFMRLVRQLPAGLFKDVRSIPRLGEAKDEIFRQNPTLGSKVELDETLSQFQTTLANVVQGFERLEVAQADVEALHLDESCPILFSAEQFKSVAELEERLLKAELEANAKQSLLNVYYTVLRHVGIYNEDTSRCVTVHQFDVNSEDVRWPFVEVS